MNNPDAMQQLKLVVCILLAAMLLLTGNAAFAQGDSSNLLTRMELRLR